MLKNITWQISKSKIHKENKLKNQNKKEHQKISFNHFELSEYNQNLREAAIVIILQETKDLQI